MILSRMALSKMSLSPNDNSHKWCGMVLNIQLNIGLKSVVLLNVVASVRPPTLLDIFSLQQLLKMKPPFYNKHC